MQLTKYKNVSSCDYHKKRVKKLHHIHLLLLSSESKLLLHRYGISKVIKVGMQAITPPNASAKIENGGKVK